MARLLFVDDEPTIRESWGILLAIHGHIPTCVGSVEEALTEIESNEYDSLICDLNIRSQNDGLLVASAMRLAQPRCKNFILTGALTPNLPDGQIDACLHKPVNVISLINALHETLRDVAS
jgi:CheY-like chemotaxis protein